MFKNLHYERSSLGVRLFFYLVILVPLLGYSHPGQAQERIITGKVTDEGGELLPGVNVLVKGTANGTVTDASGAYQLGVSGGAETLVFSFVGYLSTEVQIGGRSSIDVSIEPDVQLLGEVVVVGYGTQKKTNITGSVAQFESKQIENRPVTNVTQLFAGQITGVSAPQISGEPGADAASILIRGRGTFSGAGTEAFVLVDGLPSSLDNIDPNSIASISVLKDAASASIYGARAANGVILVTTKRGRTGGLRVNYNGYVGVQKPTAFPDYVPSWEYATLYNEALLNMGQQPLYSDAEIQKYRDGSDPSYGNANHPKELFTSGSGLQSSHNLNFSGGSENTKYFASLSYLNQEGLVRRNEFDRYTLTFNVDQKVSKNLNLGVNIIGIKGFSTEPVPTAGPFGANASVAGTVRMLYQMANLLRPTIPGRYPDGSYGYDGFNSSLAALDSKSFHSENKHDLIGSINLGWDITPALKISGKAGYVYNQGYFKTFNATFKYNENLTQGPAWLREDISNYTSVTLQSLIEYTRKFGDHSVYALGGISQQSDQSIRHNVSRSDFPSNETTVLNAGSAATVQNGGTIEEWGLRSYFGRVQYSFKDKYLFEANARYDGSSRFPVTKRYGFFPSFSAAWRVSEEPFFEVPWIDDLKLRASWGELGNQNIGNYPYQNIISLGQNYIYGGVLVPGAALTNLPNSEISWETTRITDIGMDVSLLKNKLSLEIDYFSKKTSDILYTVPASHVLGLSTSLQNAGAVLNEGWEFLATYRDNIGDFSYTIAPNFSSVRTEVLDLAGVDRIITLVANDYYTIMTPGEAMEAFYGYKTDGLFANQNDIDNYATQPGAPRPGDIKFVDISGPNGVPDGAVDAEYDRTVLGSHFPKFTFGGTIDLQYKNFDFSVLLQGVGGVQGILRRWRAQPFDDGGVNVQRWQTDRWTQENPNPDARMPRYTIGWHGGVANDFWVIDASYLRVKNLQVGYSIPAAVVNRIGLSRLRLYFSGSNLLTFSDYYEGYDPDQRLSPDARFYPVTGVYTLGVNLGF
ncbi:MAG: TonB-dependent receptor [Cyclobacteriaceae bacterium]